MRQISQSLRIVKGTRCYPLVLGILCILTAGCATATLKMYEGPEKPRGTVAVIVNEGWGLWIRNVDGKDVEVASHRALFQDYSSVALEPGEHRLGVSYDTLTQVPEFIYVYHKDFSLKVTVKGGHTYALRYTTSGGPFEPYMRVWVEDSSTGEKIATASGIVETEEFGPFNGDLREGRCD
ncbi:MAG: hypothetical protein ACE5JJ_01890 [Nitrospinota bacterium]